MRDLIDEQVIVPEAPSVFPLVRAGESLADLAPRETT
jgi:hypothetical protein